MYEFKDYKETSKQLFIKVFGQDIFNDFNKSTSDSNECNLNIFIESVFNYGVQQCKDHNLLDAQKHLALIRAMINNTDTSEVEELEKQEKNRKSFSDYITSSKDLMKQVFGFKLYNRIKNIKPISFDWNGLDVSTSSILVTTPGIKERFEENWVDYFSERDYTAIDLFLQSVFHYGFQYGIDKYVKEVRENIDLLLTSKR